MNQMSNEIVEIRFPNMEKVYFGIYRGYDGAILSWVDLDFIVDRDKKDGLPEQVRQQLGGEGTALFNSREVADAVLSAF